MDRRAFIGAVAGGLLALPFAAGGQQAGKLPRVGILLPSPRTSGPINPTSPRLRTGFVTVAGSMA